MNIVRVLPTHLFIPDKEGNSKQLWHHPNHKRYVILHWLLLRTSIQLSYYLHGEYFVHGRYDYYIFFVTDLQRVSFCEYNLFIIIKRGRTIDILAGGTFPKQRHRDVASTPCVAFPKEGDWRVLSPSMNSRLTTV